MRRLGDVGVVSVSRDAPSAAGVPGVAFWRHHRLGVAPSPPVGYRSGLRWRRLLVSGECDRWYEPAAARMLARALVDFRPDLVIVAEVWLFHYLPVLRRHGCPLVLDDHNVEAHLLRQHFGSPRAPRAILRMATAVARLWTVEQILVRASDRVWMPSARDVRLLARWYGRGVLRRADVVSNAVDVDFYSRPRGGTPPDGPTPGPHTLIFLGAFGYLPNQEAARLLLDGVFPALRRVRPDCRLVLVGRDPTPEMLRAAAGQPGVVVVGPVPDVRPYLWSADAAAVPLRRGGGTRLKILEAFAAGVPVVSTAKGAVGLRVSDGEQILIRDSIPAFAEAVGRLWSEPALAARLRKGALDLVRARYSWDVAARQTAESLSRLVAPPSRASRSIADS